jgi:import inner membrane translocase subunit TIM17
MGTIGGGLFHLIRGAKDAPKGDKWKGAIAACKQRAPILGGNFAVWGGLFSSFDCLILKLRHKEDPYNAIMAGFMTGGVLALRGGYKACFRSAMVGGIFIGVIEGASIFVQNMVAKTQMNNMLAPPPPKWKDSDKIQRFTPDYLRNEFDFVPNSSSRDGRGDFI